MIITLEGAFVIDGKVLNQLQLIEHFETLVQNDENISLLIHAPDPAAMSGKAVESVRKAKNAFRVAGAKNGVITLVQDRRK